MVSSYHDILKPSISKELIKLKNKIQSKNSKAINGCDSNAHSVFWGSKMSNPRGEDFETFIIEENFRVENVVCHLLEKPEGHVFPNFEQDFEQDY